MKFMECKHSLNILLFFHSNEQDCQSAMFILAARPIPENISEHTYIHRRNTREKKGALPCSLCVLVCMSLARSLANYIEIEIKAKL